MCERFLVISQTASLRRAVRHVRKRKARLRIRALGRFDQQRAAAVPATMSFNARLPHSPAAPVARNPYNYLAWGGQMPATYTGQSPPSNFSDQRVAKASQLVKRPLSAAKQSGYCPEKPPPPEYPLKLNGVAPADRVPVLERTRATLLSTSEIIRLALTVHLPAMC